MFHEKWRCGAGPVVLPVILPVKCFLSIYACSVVQNFSVLFKICRCCSNVTDHCTHFSFKITFLQRKSNPRNIQAPNFRVRWILKLTSKEDKRNQMKFYPIFLFNFLNVAIVQFDLIFGWINFHTFNFQTFYHFFEYLLIIKLTLFPPSQICTE